MSKLKKCFMKTQCES